MTKKHFEAIAARIRADYTISDTEAERLRLRCLTLSLSDLFASINPRFDRAKFLDAAYRTV